jgi:lysozyme family protein
MTADDAFDFAVKLVLGIEGPESDNSVTDPDGGLTRFGISQKQNPDIDVATLTVDQAIAFYKSAHWLANQCQALPFPINVMLFDSSINQGPSVGRRLLQSALRVTVDGVIGPATIAAANRADVWELAARYSAKRAVAYTMDVEWRSDGEGWIYRVAKVLTACARAPA